MKTIIKRQVKRNCSIAPTGFTEIVRQELRFVGQEIRDKLSDKLGALEDYELRVTIELIQLK